jgi:polar amino acid transport system permease protein
MIQLDFAAVLADWPLLLRGAALTLALTGCATVLGLALGIACARARTHGPAAVRALAAAYVELIRNTPFIVQLFFLFFGLPSLGVRLPPSLGRVWPAMVSQIVIVMLGSAVCGQIAAQELSYSTNLIMSRNFRSFEANFVAAGLYLAMAVLLRQGLAWAGPRWLFGRTTPAGR